MYLFYPLVISLYYHLHYAIRTSINWLSIYLPSETVATLSPIFFVTYLVGQLVAGKLMDRFGMPYILLRGVFIFNAGLIFSVYGFVRIGFTLIGLGSSTFFVAGIYNVLFLPSHLRSYCIDLLYLSGGLGTLASSASVLQLMHVSGRGFFLIVLLCAGLGSTLLGMHQLFWTSRAEEDPKMLTKMHDLPMEIPWLSAIFSALTLTTVSLVSDTYGYVLWYQYPKEEIWSFLLVISIIGSVGFSILRSILRVFEINSNTLFPKSLHSFASKRLPYLVSGLLGSLALTQLLRLFSFGANYQLLILSGIALAFYAVTRLIFFKSSLGHLPAGQEAFTIAIWNSFNAVGRLVADLYIWMHGLSPQVIQDIVVVYLVLSLLILVIRMIRKPIKDSAI
jgi:MFS family permease